MNRQGFRLVAAWFSWGVAVLTVVADSSILPYYGAFALVAVFLLLVVFSFNQSEDKHK